MLPRPKKIAVSLDAPALTRGVGFFETLWVLDRRPVFLRRHLERLVTSCRALEVPPPSTASVRRAVGGSLSAARRGEEYGMRWSYLALEKDLDEPRSWKFFSTVFPVSSEVLARRRGVRAITLPAIVQRVTPRWKTIDYRASVAGARQARRRAAEEAIFVDSRGRALEGTISNIFSLRSGRGRTPPAEAGILPGVVRAWVVENAVRAGVTIEEGNFSPSRLLGGGFFTASLTGLAPIVSLDGKKCAPLPPVFGDLRELYRDDAAAGRGDLEE